MALTEAQLMLMMKNSLNGSGSLTSGAVNKKSVLANINSALAMQGLTPARRELLTWAKNSMAAGNYQNAATAVWNVLGSQGSRPVISAPRISPIATPSATKPATPAVNPTTSSQYDYYYKDSTYIAANRSRTNRGLAALTPAEYDIISGNRARRGDQVAAQVQAAQSNYLAPENGGGMYKYSLSNAQQAAFVREKATNLSLTESQYRQRIGMTLESIAGKYVAPKLTTGNKSGATANNQIGGYKSPNVAKPTIGISNDLTGSQKIAAQSKIDASKNKATIIAAKTAAPVTPKSTLLEAAGQQFTNALTGYTAKVTAPTAPAGKNEISGAVKGITSLGFMGTAKAAASAPIATTEATPANPFGGRPAGRGVTNYNKDTVAPNPDQQHTENGWSVTSQQGVDRAKSTSALTGWIGNAVKSLGFSDQTASAASGIAAKNINNAYHDLDEISVKARPITHTVTPSWERLENTYNAINNNKYGNALIKPAADIIATPLAGIRAAENLLQSSKNTINNSRYSNTSVGQSLVKGIDTEHTISSGIQTGVKETLKDEYTGIRENIGYKGLEYGGMFASGAVGGAIAEGVKVKTGAGLIKAAAKVEKPIVKTGLTVAGRNFGTAVDVGFGGLIAADYGSVVNEGYKSGGVAGAAQSSSKFALDFAVAGAGFGKGAEAVRANKMFSGDVSLVQSTPKTSFEIKAGEKYNTAKTEIKNTGRQLTNTAKILNHQFVTAEGTTFAGKPAFAENVKYSPKDEAEIIIRGKVHSGEISLKAGERALKSMGKSKADIERVIYSHDYTPAPEAPKTFAKKPSAAAVKAARIEHETNIIKNRATETRAAEILSNIETARAPTIRDTAQSRADKNEMDVRVAQQFDKITTERAGEILKNMGKNEADIARVLGETYTAGSVKLEKPQTIKQKQEANIERNTDIINQRISGEFDAVKQPQAAQTTQNAQIIETLSAAQKPAISAERGAEILKNMQGTKRSAPQTALDKISKSEAIIRDNVKSGKISAERGTEMLKNMGKNESDISRILGETYTAPDRAVLNSRKPETSEPVVRKTTQKQRNLNANEKIIADKFAQKKISRDTAEQGLKSLGKNDADIVAVVGEKPVTPVKKTIKDKINDMLSDESAQVSLTGRVENTGIRESGMRERERESPLEARRELEREREREKLFSDSKESMGLRESGMRERGMRERPNPARERLQDRRELERERQRELERERERMSVQREESELVRQKTREMDRMSDWSGIHERSESITAIKTHEVTPSKMDSVIRTPIIEPMPDKTPTVIQDVIRNRTPSPISDTIRNITPTPISDVIANRIPNPDRLPDYVPEPIQNKIKDRIPDPVVFDSFGTPNTGWNEGIPGGVGGLPFIAGGGGGGFGFMSRRGVISNTKVATFADMIGVRKSSPLAKTLSNGLSMTPASSKKTSVTGITKAKTKPALGTKKPKASAKGNNKSPVSSAKKGSLAKMVKKNRRA